MRKEREREGIRLKEGREKGGEREEDEMGGREKKGGNKRVEVEQIQL